MYAGLWLSFFCRLPHSLEILSCFSFCSNNRTNAKKRQQPPLWLRYGFFILLNDGKKYHGCSKYIAWPCLVLFNLKIQFQGGRKRETGIFCFISILKCKIFTIKHLYFSPRGFRDFFLISTNNCQILYEFLSIQYYN